jgi:mono/diheme cytochrome c family protein
MYDGGPEIHTLAQGGFMLRILIALLLFPAGQALAQAPSGSDIQEGKRIWQGYLGLENDCKLCHGEHGEGGFAKALAGHQMTTAQFLRTVRQGAGKTMPAFVADKNLTDQQLTQVAVYLASLPKPAEAVAMWRTPVPPLASARQKLYIESGCGQCHAAVFANPRRTAGGLGGDYEWFKTEVYQHTSAPDHANSRHLRMGNFSREQVPESTLQELWQFFSVEQGLRVPINADISNGVISDNGVTYTINVSNTGRPGKGLTGEYVTITLPFLRGRDPEEVTTVVEATTGGGYTGVHRDPITNSNAAEFEIPKLGPGEKRTFTITLSGIGANSGIPRGTVRWERPKLGTGGTDLIAISTPLGR